MQSLHVSDLNGSDIMEEQVENTTGPSKPRGLRSRKVRAVLVGGLVLGVGAAITLAAWNDSEFAQGTFAAGTFNMVGSTDGTTYTEHATLGAPATLAFTVNPTSLSPGDVVYAPFAVELDANTTNDAIVTVSNAATTGAVANLTYTLIQPTAFGCTSGTTGTELVAAATAVSTVPAATTFTLTKGTPPTTAGAPVFLCFKVTAGPLIAQGQTGTATWELSAVSQ
jgi:predicted ribosomally synthesized peptide with SipW-like signal peptide